LLKRSKCDSRRLSVRPSLRWSLTLIVEISRRGQRAYGDR